MEKSPKSPIVVEFEFLQTETTELSLSHNLVIVNMIDQSWIYFLLFHLLFLSFHCYVQIGSG